MDVEGGQVLMGFRDRLLPSKIHKSFLIDGHYYAGVCRNANVARWSGAHDRFYHWRDKFGFTFVESIGYWEDDHQYDEFIPVVDLGPSTPREVNIPEEPS